MIKAGAEETYFETPGSYDDMVSGRFEYVHPADRPKARDSFAKLAMGADQAATEWRVNRKDGEEFWVQASTRMFRDDAGRPLRLVGSLQNITERKQNEA